MADLTSRAFEYPQSEEDFGSICESDQELDPADDAIPVVGTRPRLRVSFDLEKKGGGQKGCAKFFHQFFILGNPRRKRLHPTTSGANLESFECRWMGPVEAMGFLFFAAPLRFS